MKFSDPSYPGQEISEGWPRLIVFAIPLRDPLPIAHNSTFSREYADNPLPELRKVERRVTEDLPPYPQEFQGHRFVSLRIWQLNREQDTEDFKAADSAIRALYHITGQDPKTTGAPTIPELGGSSYRTVVEAVTIVRDPEDLYATETKPDPLTRCISALIDQVRAYRIARNQRISELTYERIGPIIPYVMREAFSTKYIDGLSLMLLDHANVRTPDPEMMDENALEAYRQVLGRLVKGDPFMLYAERRLEAQIALYRDGQYAESAIQGAIAAEVLLRRPWHVVVGGRPNREKYRGGHLGTVSRYG